MGIMAYALLWVMQDLYHQPWGLGFRVQGVAKQTTTEEGVSTDDLLGSPVAPK